MGASFVLSVYIPSCLMDAAPWALRSVSHKRGTALLSNEEDLGETLRGSYPVGHGASPSHGCPKPGTRLLPKKERMLVRVGPGSNPLARQPPLRLTPKEAPMLCMY